MSAKQKPADPLDPEIFALYEPALRKMGTAMSKAVEEATAELHKSGAMPHMGIPMLLKTAAGSISPIAAAFVYDQSDHDRMTYAIADFFSGAIAERMALVEKSRGKGDNKLRSIKDLTMVGVETAATLSNNDASKIFHGFLTARVMRCAMHGGTVEDAVMAVSAQMVVSLAELNIGGVDGSAMTLADTLADMMRRQVVMAAIENGDVALARKIENGEIIIPGLQVKGSNHVEG